MRPVSTLIFLVILIAPWIDIGPLSATEKGNALFTLYYLADIEPLSKGGISERVETIDGKWLKYRVSRADANRADMEGTAFITLPDGKRIVFSIMRLGLWKDLPANWQGEGNQQNPLYPFRSVAADQQIYPYGSRIYIPSLHGFKTNDGSLLDGYFWVSDVGALIKGELRFDIFVGSKPGYEEFKKFDKTKWRAPVVVESLPRAPKGWDPRTKAGLSRILERAGCAGMRKTSPHQDTSSSVRHLDEQLKNCLIEFQTRHRNIPQLEHGMATSAITLWYLTQAAIALHEAPHNTASASKQ